MKISFPKYHLFQLLKRFENETCPLDFFICHYFRTHRALGSKDRQFIVQMVYGMIRWKQLLDYLIGSAATWEKRLDLFQNFQSELYLKDCSIPLHLRVSSPKNLFELLVESYGEKKAIHLCQINNTEAPITIRVNPLKTTRKYLLEKWELLYGARPTQTSSYGIQFKKRFPLTALDEFKDGLFEIQDEASQLVASLVDISPGGHVLDYCAGSGGKTLAFAHKMNNTGQIYLHDIRPTILAQARKRLKRAGIQNGQFLYEGHGSLKNLKKKMDWVLADVPCSGTGTLRRNPDQKSKFSLDILETLIAEQKSIFEKALSFVKPGGKIVYATCSILPDENEKQIENFMKIYALKLETEYFRSLPSQEGMDGFFAAVLKKDPK